MKKRFLVNIGVIIAFLVGSFVFTGATDTDCDSSALSDISFQNIEGFSTSTQTYGGTSVSVLNLPNSSAQIHIDVKITMASNHSLSEVYGVANYNASTITLGVSAPAGVTVDNFNRTDPTDTAGINGSVYDITADVNVPSLGAGVYEIPLSYTTNKTDQYYNMPSVWANTIYVYIKNAVTDVPEAPVVQTVTSDSVTLTPVTGMEYSLDGSAWQDSNVFSGLSPNQTYTFYQRVKETDTAYASKASASLTVTTLTEASAPLESPDTGEDSSMLLLMTIVSLLALCSLIGIPMSLRKRRSR